MGDAAVKKPTPEEVEAYARSVGFEKLSGEYFVDYWIARGWLVKPGIPMKDWKAAVRNWKRMDWGQQGKATSSAQPSGQLAQERRQAYLKEYAENIQACRSWRSRPDQAPMGDPRDAEWTLWRKAKANFGEVFVADLRKRLARGMV